MENMKIEFNRTLVKMEGSFNLKFKQLSSEINKEIVGIIPIGFLYTQLPNQSSPSLLWPNMEWTEVTQSYAGLFFRAEGGNSSSFGEQQSPSSPHLTKVIQNLELNMKSYYMGNHTISLDQGKMSNKFYTGNNAIPSGVSSIALRFVVSKEEVRPINTAIKIWKRTG